MMLAASALLSSATHVVAAVFSPTSSTCKKRVAPSRYRYEPYSAQVIPQEWYVETLQATPLDFILPEPVATSVPSLAETCASLHSLRSTLPVKSPSPVKSQVKPIAPPGPRFAIIRFKHETATFLAPFRITVGDTVVVEGDRGENIGIVQEIHVEKPSFDVDKKVLRRATEKDHEALNAQRARENDAVLTTQTLADNLGLHTFIEDAEYQFDLNKLTIFVRRNSSKTFVDFRKLQRGLFREFRCRIWCAYMDEVEAAESGPRTR